MAELSSSLPNHSLAISGPSSPGAGQKWPSPAWKQKPKRNKSKHLHHCSWQHLGVETRRNKNLTTAYPGTDRVNLINEGHHEMSNKTINKEPKSFVEEFRERLNREDLERRWKLEALDHLFTESEDQPEKFHRLWIKPLMSAGLSLESAFALVVEARFRPN
jgi:hypothetical protein